METMGQRIRILRLESGLTQVELAKKLFLNKSTVAKYETDKIVPSLEICKLLAKIFDVSIDYLAGRED